MKNKSVAQRNLRKSLLCGASAVAGIVPAAMLLTAGAALAQDDDGVSDDRIIVTGSRIARKDLVATSPVNVISEDALELTGFNQVATVLNELPQAGIPGSVDTATNFRTSTSGLNTIDLRNLGEERTLILVNGRRHIGGSAGNPIVDVSMIPAPLVERVEVVTGGASAIYGSEAMAGVINFIMKDDFEGVELYSRYGGTEAGGARDIDVSITAGGNFDGGRGNAVVHVGYSDRGILESSQRARSAADSTNSSFGPKGNFFTAGVPVLLAADEVTVLEPAIPAQFLTLDESTGLFDKAFVAAEDGYNRNGDRLIRVPTERYQFNANLRYDLTEDMTFFSETAYGNLQAFSRLEPSIVGQFISVGSIQNINMPIDNPFLPPELLAVIEAENLERVDRGFDPVTELTMRRRFTEIGPRTSDVQRQIFRTAFGVEGDMPDGVMDGWQYEVYFQYGRFTQDQTNGGVFNSLNVLQALDTEPDGMGGFQCADSLARDLGCVPINFFGPNTVTGAALDWISVDNQLTARMEQLAGGVTLTGDLFELPAGTVAMAAGFEWREERSAFNSDALAASGLTSGNTIPNTKGAYDVYELFGEFIIPIIADKPFFESFNIEGAIRYADYSTIGGTLAWKAAATWSPFEDLRFRGGYNTAIRAPFIDDLFDPGSETFRSFVDPCAFGGAGGVSADDDMTVYQVQSATVQANCATIPGTATLDPFGQNIRSAGGLAAGNPDLTEEKARTYTAGMVYSPSQVPGLNITVDYFNISIENAINSFTAQTTVDQCVRQPDFPNNPFCDLIQRDPTSGLVLRVDALAINVAEFQASGIDFATDYSFDVGEIGMNVNFNGTYSLKNDFLPFAGGDIVDSQGEIGVPDLKINGTVVADWDKLRVGWSTRFIDGVNVENDQPVFGTVDSFFYHDLYLQYTLDEDGQYEFFAGVDNITDKEPPFLGQGVPGDVTGTNTAADIYDALGRRFYGGFRLSF